MYHISFKAISFLFIALLLFSCQDDDDDHLEKDTEQPSIKINSPSTTTNIFAGDDLNIDVSVSDNTALSSYVISITSAGDSQEIIYDSSSDASVPQISGTSADLNYDITIPESAQAGFYIFAISVTDESDNTRSVELSFEVSEDDTSAGAEGELSEGYVLYSFFGDYKTHLIDTVGNKVKTWTSENKSKGGYYLSSNNTLLRMGATISANTGTFEGGGGVSGIIQELNDDSEVIWSIRRDDDICTFHHDFKEIDENTIIALTWQLKEYNSKNYWNERILIIDKTDNSTIWEWSAMDDGEIIPQEGDNDDFLHFNSVDYKDGMVLVSSRSQSTVYLINRESKQVTAELTAGSTLVEQHDATFLENGNILIYNNNAENNASSVVEITTSDAIIWEYSSGFHSDRVSGAQRLGSGNTLICSGVEARLMEVTAEKKLVWDFTPEKTNQDLESTTIFKVRKYSSY